MDGADESGGGDLIGPLSVSNAATCRVSDRDIEALLWRVYGEEGYTDAEVARPAFSATPATTQENPERS